MPFMQENMQEKSVRTLMVRDVYQKSPNIVSRRIADEVVLVPIGRNLGDVECLYVLNEVGAFIWERIDGQRSLEALRDSVIEAFAVSEQQAQEDLLALFDHLREIGAVCAVADRVSGDG
jgi:hypothetical protein